MNEEFIQMSFVEGVFEIMRVCADNETNNMDIDILVNGYKVKCNLAFEDISEVQEDELYD